MSSFLCLDVKTANDDITTQNVSVAPSQLFPQLKILPSNLDLYVPISYMMCWYEEFVASFNSCKSSVHLRNKLMFTLKSEKCWYLNTMGQSISSSFMDFPEFPAMINKKM